MNDYSYGGWSWGGIFVKHLEKGLCSGEVSHKWKPLNYSTSMVFLLCLSHSRAGTGVTSHFRTYFGFDFINQGFSNLAR